MAICKSCNAPIYEGKAFPLPHYCDEWICNDCFQGYVKENITEIIKDFADDITEFAREYAFEISEQLMEKYGEEQ